MLAASWIMLIFAASGEDYTWTLCSIFVPPLAYFYGLFEWDKAGDAIKAAIIGLVLLALGLS
ncbi:MAG: hypothetical protein HKO07_00030 [Pseudomonadales bacterium]|nr:hypothetical protein [Pseudomonadales bacterium]